MNPIEIGNAAVCFAIFIASCMIIGGFFLTPKAVRITMIAAALMFVGYQLIEFVMQSFVVIVR